MYAVVAVWQLGAQPLEVQVRSLNEHVVPNVGRTPGFIAGYWTHDHATGKSHSFIVLDSEAAARAFKDFVESNSQSQARFGVILEQISMVEVVAALPTPVGQ